MNDKIDIMIVGMQKCGTTSLLRYLNEHPDVNTHQQMEMTYFYLDEEYNNGWEKAKKFYFNDADEQNIWIAKHATTIRSIKALERIKKHNPTVKCILMLREPVTRAWSSFLMEMKYSRFDLKDFDQMAEKLRVNRKIDVNDWHQNVFFGFGLYSRFIENLLKVFEPENVKILLLEALNKAPKETLREISDWGGLRDFDWSVIEKSGIIHNTMTAAKSSYLSIITNKLLSERNPGKRFVKQLLTGKQRYIIGKTIRNFNTRRVSKPEISNKTQKVLKEFYRPYNEILKEKYHINIDLWEPSRMDPVQ